MHFAKRSAWRSLLFVRLRQTDKLLHPFRVFFAVSELNTAVDVDGVRLHRLDSSDQIFRPQTAGKDDGYLKGRDDLSADRPIVHPSSAADAVRCVAVE